METKYQSKIGREIVIPIALVFCLFIFLSRDGYSIQTVLYVAPFVLFIVYLFRNTYYKINENFLQVKCGFLVNINIDIKTITQIQETNSIMSAPALSLDRLKITYNNKSVLVSPNDKVKFVDQLVACNPTIIIVPKK